MFKKVFPLILVLTIFLAACGPQGTPTLAPAEVEGTAVSSAWTMVAMTQLAIPTATALPPTEIPSPTPLPTFTALPAPTLELTPLALPTATAASGADNCVKPLDIGAAGPQSKLRFENESGGTLTLSLNMYTPNAHAECGSVSYTMGKNERLVISLPKGAYFAYAWITYSNGNTGNASGNFVNRIGEDDLLRVVIQKEVIVAP